MPIIDTENSNRQYMEMMCITCQSTVFLEFVGYTNAGECDCGMYESHAMLDSAPLDQHYGPFIDVDATFDMTPRSHYDEEDE